MSAVRQLTDALIKAGMDLADAVVLVARAGVEMAPPSDTRSKGAQRQAAWRERNKTSPTVTDETLSETSQTVSEHNKTSQRDDASLSSSVSIKQDDQEKKKKREGAKAAALPDGWRPDAEAWQATVERLGSAQRSEQELQKFKNHALDKGRVSKRWGAAWANWVDRAIVYAGGPNGNGTGQARTAQTSGSPPTRDSAVIAGMAGALERRRAARGPDDPRDAGVRDGRGAGPAGRDDAEPGTAGGDEGTHGQLALLPAANAG